MTAVVAASDTDSENSSTTSHTLNFSVSPSSGDLLLGICPFDGNDTFDTGFSGWTEVGTGLGSSQDLVVFAKESDGTEASVTATTTVNENSAIVVLRITGWDDSGALLDAITDVRGAQGGTTSEEAQVISGLTADDYLYIAYCGLSRGTNTITFPTGYTAIAQRDSSGAGGVVVGASYKSTTNTTGDSPSNFTFANADHEEAVTGLIAIAPGAAGGGSALRLLNAYYYG